MICPARVIGQEDRVLSEREAALEDSKIGLNMSLDFQTAYVFRGYNVFQQDSQLDQQMLFAPGISWNILGSGIELGYWGAYQVTGDNIGENVASALGTEQDLYLNYPWELTQEMALSFGTVLYLYPGADASITGADVPIFIEPGIGFNASLIVDLGLNASYFFGIQDEAGIRGISYLYINPTVAKQFTLTPQIELGLGLGYGFKLFKEGNDGAGNIHDISVSVALPICLRERVCFSPGFNVAWTDLADTVDAETGEATEFKAADGFALWGGITISSGV